MTSLLLHNSDVIAKGFAVLKQMGNPCRYCVYIGMQVDSFGSHEALLWGAGTKHWSHLSNRLLWKKLALKYSLDKISNIKCSKVRSKSLPNFIPEKNWELSNFNLHTYITNATFLASKTVPFFTGANFSISVSAGSK